MGRGRRLATGISARLSSRDLRRFGLTVAIPFGLLAAVGAWRGHTLIPVFFVSLGAILAGLALLAPGTLAPVEKLWMGVAHALGWFNTRLILGLVHFLVITPTGLVMRLVGRDPMDRRLMDRQSYWVTRPKHPPDRSAMEHQF